VTEEDVMLESRTSVSVGGTPRIVASFVGNQSPDEVLTTLDKFNIEWHISDEGHLMIRTWQVVARDFVTKEQANRLRVARPTPRDADALGWLCGHLAELQSNYGGKWVSILGDRVVASASTVQDLMAELDRMGVTAPFVTQIPAEDVVWKTTYGG
jgi:hypothetical protein